MNNTTKILIVRYGAQESMAAGSGNIAAADVEQNDGLGWEWIENAIKYFEPNTPAELVIIVSGCCLSDTLSKSRLLAEEARDVLESAGWDVAVIINCEGIPPISPEEVCPTAYSMKTLSNPTGKTEIF